MQGRVLGVPSCISLQSYVCLKIAVQSCQRGHALAGVSDLAVIWARPLKWPSMPLLWGKRTHLPLIVSDYIGFWLQSSLQR